ncbi:HalOD1 output domain-containing protein [Haloarcula onubensis]|uniref:Halobacterial output domain-containing protein n=1 Tax=Haloarcula onubensis TaxID=2950539 RepID=A0ABU2FKA2_9EURY|nr:HalOD1 output domain-containing protein [Halomicroarcula sp. S3CR25-11]MDS0281184.1 hypothetical protein [Halomicroarcula sp. S3CR25-11]
MEHRRNQDVSMTVEVVEAVSAFENRDPTALPPLHDVVDTDALDAMFEPGRSGGDRECRVAFEFSDSHVTVENGERIVVRTDRATSATGN